MEKHKPEEKSFITVDESGEKKLSLDVFIKTVILRCMGKSLDYARISGMADRSLQQFERTIKDDYYKIIEDAAKILKDFGYPVDEQGK